jgi:uncharacterized membrane protein
MEFHVVGIIWFVLSVLVTRWARTKGHGIFTALFIFLLSLVLSPLVGFIVVFFMNDRSTVCPNCGARCDSVNNCCDKCGWEKKD